MEATAVRDFARKIKDKKDLYEAAVRNGFYLPSLKSSIVTEAYIINVIECSTFSLKMEDIRMKACPRPPNKEVLVAKFLDIMRRRDIKTHGIDDSHMPDKAWLITVLSSLKPDDKGLLGNRICPVTTKDLAL